MQISHNEMQNVELNENGEPESYPSGNKLDVISKSSLNIEATRKKSAPEGRGAKKMINLNYLKDNRSIASSTNKNL